MAPLRAALILDDSLVVPEWQYNALKAALDKNLLHITTVLHCQNSQPKRHLLKHFAYYALRSLYMKPRAWRPKNLAELLPFETKTLCFHAGHEGIWEKIPQDVLEQTRHQAIDVAIKFGMGLLKGAAHFPSQFGILSYHHGDPEFYRGRPAGFYELLNNSNDLGAIVQRISDQLDAGEIIAKGKFKIYPHSYRKSLQSLYRGSEHLLAKAIQNLLSGVSLRQKPSGRIYRLPDNLQVLRFLGLLVCRNASRLIYGACIYKEWQLGLMEFTDDLISQKTYTITDYRLLNTPSNYLFLADSFFSRRNENVIYCEAFCRRTGKGEIIAFSEDSNAVIRRLAIVPRNQHASFPYVLWHKGKEYIIPEISMKAPPMICQVEEGEVTERWPIRGLESLRVVDIGLYYKDDRFWLFGSLLDECNDRLRLWGSMDLRGEFAEHPQSPIRCDPRGGRLGGIIFQRNGQILRFGQNNLQDYGNGLSLYRINELTEVKYVETEVGNISIHGLKGPHTIDIRGNRVVFDCYRERFHPLAFYFRILNRV